MRRRPTRLTVLSVRPDFLAVAATRVGRITPGFTLQARLAPDDEKPDRLPRVGFTATRRLGSAVVRNRAKRRMRALAADVLDLVAADGADYVMIARDAILTRPYPALEADLAQAVARIHAGDATLHRHPRRGRGGRKGPGNRPRKDTP